MADFVRRPSPPPLQAYTSSKLEKAATKNIGKPKTKAIRRVKPGVSETYRSQAPVASRPRPRRAAGKIEFDESARREYLTGFHKRKQAKLEKGKERAREREKEERRLLRVETREARKKQAAENVAAEKEAYGAGSDENESEDGNDDEEDALLPSAFDDEQHHTTVTVQDFDPNAPDAEPAAPPKKARTVKEALPPSSRRMTKKLKNSLAGAKEISKLIDSDEEDAVIQERDYHSKEGAFTAHTNERKGKVVPKKPRKFHYESKLERAKNRSQARETKAKWAEKRREERNAGGGKPRMQKNKGKRGLGNKGKKR